MRQRERASILLFVGAALGLVLAAAGFARPRSDVSVGAGTIARVNGQPIRSEDYARAVAALAQDRREGLANGDRQHVMDRLIDEELLVQRGLELGLARRDAKVRADLTSAVIAAAAAGADDREPTDSEVAEFYARERDFFARPGRVRARQIFCRAGETDDPAALVRAHEAAIRLRAGEDFAAVRAAYGDEELAPLPDAPLPPTALREYLGPTALRTVLELPPGAVSEPVRSGVGYHVLQVLDRQPDTTPPLADIRGEVTAEFRRRAGENALRAYLDGLRARAHIEQVGRLP
jgi:parvulin-like peptidyl-prolyl isomerase